MFKYFAAGLVVGVLIKPRVNKTLSRAVKRVAREVALELSTNAFDKFLYPEEKAPDDFQTYLAYQQWRATQKENNR